jgi:integrase
METLRLRVKDIDFEYSQIVVRDGKGKKDRVTILADAAASALPPHL